MSASTVDDQLLEAQIEMIKEKREADPSLFSVFKTGDPEIDNAVEGGGLAVSSTDNEWVTIYDTATGEPRRIKVSQLKKTFLKKRAGKPAFSMTPQVTYRMGKVMCYLHPEHPDREEIVAMGLNAVCETMTSAGVMVSAGNLASEYDRDQHMAHRHPREWNVIKEHRERKEREEERALRRQEIAAMQQMAARRGPGRPRKDESDAFEEGE